MASLYSKVKVDDRLFTPVQVHKLIEYMRDRHGVEFFITAKPNCGINGWCCNGNIRGCGSSRIGHSLWSCVSRFVVDVALPTIELERRGGN